MRTHFIPLLVITLLFTLIGCASIQEPSHEEDTLLVIPLRNEVKSKSSLFGHYVLTMRDYESDKRVAQVGLSPDDEYETVKGLSPGAYYVSGYHFRYDSGTKGSQAEFAKERFPVNLDHGTLTLSPAVFGNHQSQNSKGNYWMRFYADYPDNIEEIHEGLIETLENDYPEEIAAWDIAAPQEVARRFTFEFQDVLTGRSVSSAELEGKVLVIDFWATWCGPCRSEIPHMLELYEKYRDRNVEFIGISLDKNSEELKSFCEKRGMSWPQHCVDGKTWDTELSRKWGVRSIPAMFVIDRRNHIVSTEARGRLESIIEKTLAE